MAIPAMPQFPLAIEIAGIATEHELASNSSEDIQQLTMLGFRHFECIFPGRRTGFMDIGWIAIEQRALSVLLANDVTRTLIQDHNIP